MLENKILKKLKGHGTILNQHTARFDQHDARFDEHDAHFDRVFIKLIEHDKRFERIEQRLDNMVTRDEYLTGQDKIMAILLRLEQEFLFMGERLRRLDKASN
jgi:hypothetical protein